MKVLFQTRTGIFNTRGGDTVQVENTAKELRLLGVEVDISSSWQLDVSKYDLVHIFQLDWICEPYLQAKNAKKYNKPLILSPIHHSEEEVKYFEKHERYDFRRIANILFPNQESKDVLKNIYRAFIELNVAKIYPTLLSIKDGYRNEQKKVLEMSDLVLVQTQREATDLEKDFGVKVKWQKVVNGVGEIFLTPPSTKLLDITDYIITVGRIEARKNQLRIIEAVKKYREEYKKDIKLVVVGAPNNRNLEYNFYFRRELKKYEWIYYIPSIEWIKMPEVYNGAKVCVSASFFETTGLTLLEAVFCGCNVVASSGSTGERVKEYLGTLPFYCAPSDILSIKEAIKLAYEGEKPKIEPEMKQKYTWSSVAKETLKVYNELLGS